MIENKSVRLSVDKQLISGVPKRLGDHGSMILFGKKYSVTELVTLLQRRVDVTENVTAAKAAYEKALLLEREELAATRRLVGKLRHMLKLMFTSSAEALADLGLTPALRRPATLVEKVDAVAKALATRAARHTMGPRQRERIHGAPVTHPQVAVADPPKAATATSPPENAAMTERATLAQGSSALAPPKSGLEGS
jgi:hypothetical protein